MRGRFRFIGDAIPKPQPGEGSRDPYPGPPPARGQAPLDPPKRAGSALVVAYVTAPHDSLNAHTERGGSFFVGGCGVGDEKLIVEAETGGVDNAGDAAWQKTLIAAGTGYHPVV